jgi:hypothetical protein
MRILLLRCTGAHGGAARVPVATPLTHRRRRLSPLPPLHCVPCATQELTAVRDAAPRECSVHFWLGRLCKRLGRLDDAVRHLTAAQDLNPKVSGVWSVVHVYS